MPACRSQNQRPELHTKLHVWAVLKTPWLLDSLVQSENRAFCNCAHGLLILTLSTKIPSKFSHMMLKRHLWSWPFGTKTMTSSFYLRFAPCNFFSFIIHYYHPFSLFITHSLSSPRSFIFFIKLMSHQWYSSQWSRAQQDRGTWVAQSVKCPTWSWLRSWSQGLEIKSQVRLHTQWGLLEDSLPYSSPYRLPLK